MDDDAKSLDEISAEKEYCLVLGSESHGVDDIIEDLATDKVKIEMGDQIESLNVASAAAIIFNAVYKKLKNVK